MAISCDFVRLRSAAFLATKVSALALLVPQGAALAQENADDAAEEDRAIIVTGSRIPTDGTQAPVPVTVVAADVLEARQTGSGLQDVCGEADKCPTGRLVLLEPNGDHAVTYLDFRPG